MNLKAKSGESALHAAAEADHSDVAKALIVAGRPCCFLSCVISLSCNVPRCWKNQSDLPVG